MKEKNRNKGFGIELKERTDFSGSTRVSSIPVTKEVMGHFLWKTLKDLSLEEVASLFSNPVDAIAEYAALCSGKSAGKCISLLFNPHRLDIRTKGSKVSVYSGLQQEKCCVGLARAFVLYPKKTPLKRFYSVMQVGYQGINPAQEFPPIIARKIYKMFGISLKSRILDPCGGWGGRMLGASSVCDSYTCYEPATRTAEGLKRLRSFIQGFRKDFKATIQIKPFEDAVLKPNKYDIALTSPPYYDTELYSDENTNSCNRYGSFDEWCDGFFYPLITKTVLSLKVDAPFVLNIGSRKYPLNKRLSSYCKKREYLLERVKGHFLAGASGIGKTGEGETFYCIRKSK